VLAFSQPTKRRIEEVLNPKKTESEIEKEKLKTRLNNEAELTNSCIDKLFSAKQEIDSLKGVVKDLEAKYNQQQVDVVESKLNETTAKEIMLKEHKKRRIWTKVAIGEGAIIVGGIVGIVTGAWVPVCIAVGINELYLLVEGKVQINIKQTKI
jgi:uncharacterized membrane protein YcjF (UPF0283 family)